ncbi:hypothetical protein [Citrobacter koseri]|nr:hypothetical protein [Citrobacter koseri]STB73291.1 Uncharacterised protein [Citrobacter koseri]STT23470.1 Uncharacterised protein [Citrobacter koseri]
MTGGLTRHSARGGGQYWPEQDTVDVLALVVDGPWLYAQFQQAFSAQRP